SVPAPTGQNAAVLSTAEIYWPAARGFWPVKAMSSSRSNHCAVLLANGGVLIMGGVQTVFAPSFAGPTVPWILSSSDLFNSLTGQFTSGPSMTAPRDGLSATLLNNGSVLVIGGGTSTAELYDSQANRFNSTGPMAVER